MTDVTRVWWLVALIGAGLAGYLLADPDVDAAAAREPTVSAAEPQHGGESLPAAAASEPATLYQYMDDAGRVQFASRLEAIPAHLRDDALPVGP